MTEWSLPIPTLNNYVLECTACETDTFIYWLGDEIPGYYDPIRGMRCPCCDSRNVQLCDCDERQPRHRLAKRVYQRQHPELFASDDRTTDDDALRR